jgi:hypothetical protein
VRWSWEIRECLVCKNSKYYWCSNFPTVQMTEKEVCKILLFGSSSGLDGCDLSSCDWSLLPNLWLANLLRIGVLNQAYILRKCVRIILECGRMWWRHYAVENTTRYCVYLKEAWMEHSMGWRNWKLERIRLCRSFWKKHCSHVKKWQKKLRKSKNAGSL